MSADEPLEPPQPHLPPPPRGASASLRVIQARVAVYVAAIDAVQMRSRPALRALARRVGRLHAACRAGGAVPWVVHEADGVLMMARMVLDALRREVYGA